MITITGKDTEQDSIEEKRSCRQHRVRGMTGSRRNDGAHHLWVLLCEAVLGGSWNSDGCGMAHSGTQGYPTSKSHSGKTLHHVLAAELLVGMKTDGNRQKNSISTFVSIFFWRKREQVRKMRVRKRNRNMRTYGNKKIRMESQKIILRSHNLIFSKYTYIKSCNNIYKV
jgi:hypothetical protein